MEHYYIENPELIINDDRDWHDISEFDFDIIEEIPTAKCLPKSGERRKKRFKKPIDMVNAVGAFDLENSKIPHTTQGAAYIFMFALLMIATGDLYFFGFRTYECLCSFFDNLARALGLRVLNIWDFNFSYEWHYLIGAFDFTNNKGETEVFFKDATHPLCAYSHNGAIYWRDAQALFGPGKLKDHTVGLPHAKLDGELDYTKKRFYFTEIEGRLGEQDEIGYCINDVFSICERIVYKEMPDRHQSINGIPLTFTGYIRKTVARILRPYSDKGKPYDWHEAYPEALTKPFEEDEENG